MKSSVRDMAKKHFLEILPFVATIAALALLAAVALSIPRRAPDTFSRGASSALGAGGTLDRASMETLWADSMWQLSGR